MLDLLAEATRHAQGSLELSPLEAGDLEDQLTEQLEVAGVEEAWAVAPSLVSAGLDNAWLRRVIAATGDAAPDAVRWLATALDIENLVREIRSSAGRISELVAAMKDYSHLDRSKFDKVDVHDGLESTLVIFGHKIKRGVKLVRDYDRSLPKISCASGRAQPGLDQRHRQRH